MQYHLGGHPAIQAYRFTMAAMRKPSTMLEASYHK